MTFHLKVEEVREKSHILNVGFIVCEYGRSQKLQWTQKLHWAGLEPSI